METQIFLESQKINLMDVVALLKPLEGLRLGQVGVVVEVLDSLNYLYEIEFCNKNGETIRMLAVEKKHLLKLVYEAEAA